MGGSRVGSGGGAGLVGEGPNVGDGFVSTKEQGYARRSRGSRE